MSINFREFNFHCSLALQIFFNNKIFPNYGMHKNWCYVCMCLNSVNWLLCMYHIFLCNFIDQSNIIRWSAISQSKLIQEPISQLTMCMQKRGRKAWGHEWCQCLPALVAKGGEGQINKLQSNEWLILTFHTLNFVSNTLWGSMNYDKKSQLCTFLSHCTCV